MYNIILRNVVKKKFSKEKHSDKVQILFKEYLLSTSDFGLKQNIVI